MAWSGVAFNLSESDAVNAHRPATERWSSSGTQRGELTIGFPRSVCTRSIRARVPINLSAHVRRLGRDASPGEASGSAPERSRAVTGPLGVVAVLVAVGRGHGRSEPDAGRISSLVPWVTERQ